MPGGLIAWGKNRFLKRKSPERAVHVVLPPEPIPRHVSFDQWTDNQPPGRSNSNLSSQPSNQPVNRNPEWRYTDDVRIQIAPMARAEDLDARERRALSAPRTNPLPMASSHNEYAPIAKDAFIPGDIRDNVDDVNVVFLQRNDEVKRTMLPAGMRTMRQVHIAFARSFNLSMSYLQLPSVRIYIQEPHGQLFYELEDPSDIRDKSVLRLKETPSCSSPSSRLDYVSDPELGGSMTSSVVRPASAMAAFSPQNFGHPPKNSGVMYDPYDVYASDTASSLDSRSIPRSESATPIIDREARVRMDTMERQLQGLSSLVHSALKGMDETSVRDMEILRRQVLNLGCDPRLPSEEPPSLPDSSMSGSREERNSRSSRERELSRQQQQQQQLQQQHQQQQQQLQQLARLRERVQQTGTEMRQLRRVAQMNAQNSREIIRTTGDEILKLIAERLGRRAESVIPTRSSDARREEHGRQLANLLQDLTAFEQNVEEVRSSVLSTNRKLRMSEVERLTTSLTEIGRAAANLKTAIPSVHGQNEADLLSDVERLRGERAETTTALDQSLRRCKALANIMVTMKKLAMVQDPAMLKLKHSTSASSGSGSPSNGVSSSINASSSSSHASSFVAPAPSMAAPPSPSPSAAAAAAAAAEPVAANLDVDASEIPPVPPSPAHYNSPMSSMAIEATPSLREETPTAAAPSGHTSVSGVAIGSGGGAPPPPSPLTGQPPRPPSRYSVKDARQRAPPQIQTLRVLNQKDGIMNGTSLSMGTAPSTGGLSPQSSPIQLSSSPIYDTDAESRRVRLEERQAALAEKQRLLHSQFAQLQQLAP